jgi:serpin B
LKKFIILASAFLAFVCPAIADMGGIHASNAVINEDSQKAVILHNFNQEVLILGADMSSDTATAVLRFIPFPSEPKVSLAPAGALEAAAKLIKRHRLKFIFYSKGGGPSLSGVEIKFSEKLGEHDLTAVRINDIAAFREWVKNFLREKGMPSNGKYPDVEKTADDYVKRGINYFVFDLVDLTPEIHSVAPLMFVFDSKMLYYPLETSDTFSGDRGVNLTLITPVTLGNPGIFGKDYLSLKNFTSSTSAKIPAYELGDIYPDYAKFFGERNIYIQLVRHYGEYDFKDDIMLDPSKGADKEALATVDRHDYGRSFLETDRTTLSDIMPGHLVSLEDANGTFAVELYKKAAAGSGTEGKNIFFSPYSVSTALAVVAEGAKNSTMTQMYHVLHFDMLSDRLRDIYPELIEKIKKSGNNGCTLLTANAIWGQQDYTFEDDYLDLLDVYYGGGFSEADFSGHTERSRGEINRWAENNTGGRIKELLAEGDLDPATVLILTNAVYFKGSWDVRFKKEETHKGVFHTTEKEKEEVDMMSRTGDFSYGEAGGKAVLLEIPYRGNELSMVIILPGGGIGDLEKGLTYKDLKTWLALLKPEKNVEVEVPKFKFTARYYLQSLLEDMGMTEPFSANGDLSGISKDGHLSISKVIHQAAIEVNEEGTEASAATAVVMDKMMPFEFRADRPFIFLILHKPTNTILFMGRVMDPQKGG